MISNQSSFHQMKENIRQSYVNLELNKDGFHSERHQTTNSMDIGTYSIEQKHLGIEYHIKYPVQALLTHIKDIFNSKGFKVTQVFPGKLLMVKLGFTDRIRYIFTGKHPNQYLVTLSTNQYRSVRKLTIQRISSESSEPIEGGDQIHEYLKLIEDEPLNITHSPLNNDEQNQNDIDTSEYQHDMYSLEATSTYMYHKIFIDRNYSIGKKMKKLVQQGPGANSTGSIEELKKQIHEVNFSDSKLIVGGLNEITEDMLQNFNCTRKQLLEILCHCRQTVEEYYHNSKFDYKNKEQIEFQMCQLNQSLQNANMIEKIPQTVKSFKKLSETDNSISILRQIFMCHFIFQFQCHILSINDPDKKQLGEKIGKIFRVIIQEKIKILQLWGYSHQCWDQYISVFYH